MDTTILISIIVGIVAAILGYLFGKMAGGNKGDLQALENQNAKLQADLDTCRKKLNQIEVEDMRMAAAMKRTGDAFNAAEAKSVMGKPVKENDLTIIEGIGPAIQNLFHKHGIHTWKALSEASVDTCQSILDSEEERFTIHKPSTWPDQAKLASEGNWKKLKDWQDELQGGK